MSCYQWLQVIGLFLALIGAFSLSIDALGKTRVYKFVHLWFERFMRQRRNVYLWIGIIVAFIAVLLINVWKVPLVDAIVPLMFKYPVISICVSTILTLAVIQFAIGGWASFRRIGRAITTNAVAFYRVIASPNRWGPLLSRLKGKRVSGFRVSPVAFLYLLLFGLVIAYITTKSPLFWTSSIAIDLTFVIMFVLVMFGALLGWFISKWLQFYIRRDAEETFLRLSVTGFILLSVGFTLQIIAVFKS